MFIFNYFKNNNDDNNNNIDNQDINNVDNNKSNLKKRYYGWKSSSSVNDHHFYKHDELFFLDNIKHVDLRDKCPPIYDQGELGSCTANAIAAAFEFDELNQFNNKDYKPSRLYIYYNERLLEGTTDEDSGASISDSV